MNTHQQPPACPGYDPDPRPIQTRLPPRACDSHFHIFGPLSEYPFKRERSYTPPEAPESAYRRLLKMYGFSRSVFIQPSVYGTDNSRMMALLAGQDGDDVEWRGIAVVGEEIADRELERMHQLGVRGIRLNLLFKGGVDFDTVKRLAERIAPMGWHVQFLIDVSEFEDLGPRLSGLPVPSVVDHMGHLPTRKTVNDRGFRDLLALVADGRTWVKLSGPYRLTELGHAPYTDVDPFAGALIKANPNRMLFGTDWPHPGIAKPMPNDGDLIDEFLRWTDGDSALIHQIMVDNPAVLYGFPV